MATAAERLLIARLLVALAGAALIKALPHLGIGGHKLAAAIALATVAIAGWPFFASAARAARARSVNMDTGLAAAVALSLFASLFATLQHDEPRFASGAMLLVFLLAGRTLERRLRPESAAPVAARGYAALAAAAALGGGLGWAAAGGPASTALHLAVAVLIAASPCALLPAAPVRHAVALAARPKRLTMRNLRLPALSCAVAVPLALAGLLSPPLAALATSGVSLLATRNALKPSPGGPTGLTA